MLVELVLIVVLLLQQQLLQLIQPLTLLIQQIPQVVQKEEEFFKIQQTLQIQQQFKIFKIVHHIKAVYVWHVMDRYYLL